MKGEFMINQKWTRNMLVMVFTSILFFNCSYTTKATQITTTTTTTSTAGFTIKTDDFLTKLEAFVNDPIILKLKAANAANSNQSTTTNLLADLILKLQPLVDKVNELKNNNNVSTNFLSDLKVKLADFKKEVDKLSTTNTTNSTDLNLLLDKLKAFELEIAKIPALNTNQTSDNITDMLKQLSDFKADIDKLTPTSIDQIKSLEAKLNDFKVKIDSLSLNNVNTINDAYSQLKAKLAQFRNSINNNITTSKPKQYTVTIINKFNKNNKQYTIQVDENKIITNLKTYKVNNYRFDGWFNSANVLFDISNTKINSNLVLTAKYTKLATVNLNTSNTNKPSSKKVVSKKTAIKKAVMLPTTGNNIAFYLKLILVLIAIVSIVKGIARKLYH
ncbi:hypothetical protein [Mycoplasma sp. P36-A1]|uniref:hypothetical protein n=1 Tax=Mycoplasma sp. P36-A1 TaxID=3252900 RepID=UPI003C2B2E9E